MEEADQQYIDGKFDGVGEKIDHNQEVMVEHVMDIKTSLATQNGSIKLAAEKAKNADKKADEAKDSALSAHKRISSLVLMLLILVGGAGVGFLSSVLLKLF